MTEKASTPVDASAVATGRNAPVQLIVATPLNNSSQFKLPIDVQQVQTVQSVDLDLVITTVSGLSLIGIDAGNYSLGSTTASTVALMTPKSLDVLGTLVADKPEDGNTSARVTVGSLSGLVGPELLRVTAQGNFLNADVGTDKPVDVSYALLNGINGGLAANYSISNQMFKANITSVSKSNPVQPVITPSKPASSSKVVIANAQAAVGRSDTESKNEIRQECSFLHPEKCECQDTAVVGVQLCVAPAPAEARGVDLTDRLNAVLGLPAK